MDLFQDDGTLREYVRVMKNGKQIVHQDGLETGVADGDTLSVFPPVAGG
jgi:molybdopterin synthase sulfur carrier subunit